ncbi:MAG: FMN-binding negative transcriptional regulator [Pseudomonadota bacterium]|nr:FMN-binding negative transcriptional regulator [Pseudomonadota bacterium]
MHPNPAYRKADDAANLAFARARGFGILTAAGAADPQGFPLLSHIPFVLSDDGTRAELHLVRSNPLARALTAGPLPAAIAVSGPDGYISPDWYGDPQQVPTWNYVAVHLRGVLRLEPQAALEGFLDRLSDRFETAIPDKKPWKMSKMDRGALDKLLRMIVPASLDVAQVDGTWKLNQNKPEAARLGAAAAVETGSGAELAALAALMREPPA